MGSCSSFVRLEAQWMEVVRLELYTRSTFASSGIIGVTGP
jgi:hypothetical protein